MSHEKTNSKLQSKKFNKKSEIFIKERIYHMFTASQFHRSSLAKVETID
ncbi:MAG: hypothetical protein HJJLKODD_02523 [Phycisphaerae bacterium]|nr:hypothetical protein [Phycisphaerae bacterium]